MFSLSPGGFRGSSTLLGWVSCRSGWLVRKLLVVGEAAGILVHFIDPTRGGNPYDPRAILVEVKHRIIAQAVRVVWVIVVMKKPPVAGSNKFKPLLVPIHSRPLPSSRIELT